MEKEIKHYLITKALLCLIVNFVVNGFVAYLFINEYVPILGWTGFLLDFIGTCFILPLLLTLFESMSARIDLKRGRINHYEGNQKIATTLYRFPDSLIIRALVFAIFIFIILAPLGILIILGSQFTPSSMWSFVIIKATYGGIMAGILNPFILIMELRDKN